MDDQVIGTDIDLLHQGEKDDPQPQRRHPSPLAGKLGGTGHQSLLQQRLAGLSLEDLEETRRLRQQPPDAVGDDLLDLRRRDAQPGGIGTRSDDQRAGDVITVTLAILDRMGRCHAVPLAVEQQSGEQAGVLHPNTGAALDRVLGKAGLHRIPQRGVDDRRVLARVGLVLVYDLAAIDPVLQYQVERAAADRLAAPAPARSAGPALAGDAVGFELRLQESHRADYGIAAEDVTHHLGLALDDDQLSVHDRVAERRHAAHPHAFLLRSGNLVADALARDLALELGKGQQHVEVSLPIEVVVLNCWVTDTNDTPLASKISTILAKSASERVSRSIL